MKWWLESGCGGYIDEGELKFLQETWDRSYVL